MPMKRLMLGVALLLAPMPASGALAQQWVVSWTGAVHGPYPSGNPTAQPELKFAFPSPEQGARNQSFRMIVKPDVWGSKARFRLSKVFGTKPVTLNEVYVGLQESGDAGLRGCTQ